MAMESMKIKTFGQRMKRIERIKEMERETAWA